MLFVVFERDPLAFAGSVPSPFFGLVIHGKHGMHYLNLPQFPHFAQALKLGQRHDNSNFLPASHKAMASLYPSWQRVRTPGEGMESRTVQKTPEYLCAVGNSIRLPISLQEKNSFFHNYCNFIELSVIADR